MLYERLHERFLYNMLSTPITFINSLATQGFDYSLELENSNLFQQ